ncbi:MAG: Fpg/Nei family DNA glycosylase [Planctomycetaceae bacterium]|nr:Fpg/Nei family DNA glycosylase [Planctomycetaceae bacterium]
MPEGHTIHRIARDHQRDFAGQKMKISSPQGRFSDGAEILTGRTLQGVEAHGKHLCYCWSGGKRLHIHLGLYGKFRRHKMPLPEPRGQVRLRAIGDRNAFDLNGPTACEVIKKQDWAAIQDRLGPDPLRDDADVDRVWDRIQKSRSAIGTLLLNQAVIAGVGNVYRSEVLHLLQIHPDTPGNALSREQFDVLWQRIQTLLKIGVKYNRIIIAEPEDVGKPRSRMNRSERLLVYKRDFCIRCDAPIESWILGSRKVFACTRCQPR